MGCGGSIEEKHPGAKYQNDDLDSNCDTEARDLMLQLSRKNSQAGENASEPGECSKALSWKATILKASLSNDINDDPDQFMAEIRASVPEVPEREKKRCREWIDLVQKCHGPGERPEPLLDWREARRQYRKDVVAGIIQPKRGSMNGSVCSAGSIRSKNMSPKTLAVSKERGSSSDLDKQQSSDHPHAVPNEVPLLEVTAVDEDHSQGEVRSVDDDIPDDGVDHTPKLNQLGEGLNAAKRDDDAPSVAAVA